MPESNAISVIERMRRVLKKCAAEHPCMDKCYELGRCETCWKMSDKIVKGCLGKEIRDALKLEVECERLLPCPFCGEQAAVVNGKDGHLIVCDCGYRSQVVVGREECIARHNRLALAVMEKRGEI